MKKKRSKISPSLYQKPSPMNRKWFSKLYFSDEKLYGYIILFMRFKCYRHYRYYVHCQFIEWQIVLSILAFGVCVIGCTRVLSHICINLAWPIVLARCSVAKLWPFFYTKNLFSYALRLRWGSMIANLHTFYSEFRSRHWFFIHCSWKCPKKIFKLVWKIESFVM